MEVATVSDETDRGVLYWETGGVLMVFLVGTAVHIAGHFISVTQPTLGLVTVNESLWEHLKMGFWPLVVLGVIQYPWLGEDNDNFLVAKVASAFTVMGTVFVLVTAYNQFSSEPVLIDIITFAVSCCLGQVVSYRVLQADPVGRQTRRVALGGAVAVAVSFWVFAVAPPPLELFQDPMTGGYGPQ